jgi:multidrug efflux pump subunit AcrA (membrane-fusion protein)
VLRLPRELVRVRSDGTAQIKVWNGQQIEQRMITVGLRGDSFVEVLAGLREGERVVSE